jgi:hypothetical protein
VTNETIAIKTMYGNPSLIFEGFVVLFFLELLVVRAALFFERNSVVMVVVVAVAVAVAVVVVVVVVVVAVVVVVVVVVDVVVVVVLFLLFMLQKLLLFFLFVFITIYLRPIWLKMRRLLRIR